jgi:hypothetical protein
MSKKVKKRAELRTRLVHRFLGNFKGLLSFGNFSYKAVQIEGMDCSYSLGKSPSPVLFRGKQTST